MALENVGVDLKLANSRIPANWTTTKTDNFKDWIHKTQLMKFTVKKTNVEKPTEAATFDEIIDHATYGILKLTEDELALMLDAGKDYLYWIQITKIHQTDTKETYYTDADTEYLLDVTAFVKIGILP